MKRRLLIAAAVVVVVLGVLAAPFVAAFAGLAPVSPVTELPGASFGVADGYVQAFGIAAGGGTVVLIDCGNDPTAATVKAELQRRNLTPSAIFLTHGHSDHTNGCNAFAGVPIYALAVEKPLIEGEVAAKGPLTRFAKNDPAKSPRVTNPLADGDEVVIGTVTVKVFATPGHTAGSASYFANSVLFMGDAATAQADGFVRNAPWLFSDDLAEAKASVQALPEKIKGEVKMIAFAHSGPIAGVEKLRAPH